MTKTLCHVFMGASLLALMALPCRADIQVSPPGASDEGKNPVELPIQSYGVIDLSGDATDERDTQGNVINHLSVTHIALDDSSNGAFGFYDKLLNAKESLNKKVFYQVYKWKSGVREETATKSIKYLREIAGTAQTGPEWSHLLIKAVTSAGGAYGEEEHTHNYSNNPDEDPLDYVVDNHYEMYGSTTPPDPPFPTGWWDGEHYGCAFTAVSDNGIVAGRVIAPPTWPYMFIDFTKSHSKVFAPSYAPPNDGGDYSQYAPMIYRGNDAVGNRIVSVNNMAAFTSIEEDATHKMYLYDNGTVHPLGAGFKPQLNEQKDVVGYRNVTNTGSGNATNTSSGVPIKTEAVFWRNYNPTVISGKLSKVPLPQIKEMVPLALSNRDSVTHDVYVLASANVLKGADPGTWKPNTLLVWRIPMNGDWDCRVVCLPDGVADSLVFESMKINSKGIIAAIGDPDSTIDTSEAKHALLLAPAELVVDLNHDKQIDAKDRVHTTDPQSEQPDPFFFWINDDDDMDDTVGSDVPGQPYVGQLTVPNFLTWGADINPHNSAGDQTGKINGVRDLVDFFPVWLHIKDLLKLFPADQFDYHLAQADEALNFTDTELKAAGASNERAGAYLNDYNVAQNLAYKSVQKITVGGIKLTVGFLNGIKDDETGQRGVILVEGRQTTSEPLILEVFRHTDNKKIIKFELPLSIGPVEKMYRQKNLRRLAHNTEGLDDYMAAPGEEPEDYPDRLCNAKKFVSLHGYSVSGNAARGWGAEMFKRLYWSGSRAKFYAVTWLGNETQFSLEDYSSTTPDYHANVNNAFSAARWLADYLMLIGRAEVVAGHSLGNMVVSSAIEDWNAPIGKYFMIDAAVAAEAYSGDEAKNSSMDHPLWSGVLAERLWASEWHSLFDAADNRSRLTWRGRFAKVDSNAYNFYSGTEDTLAEHVGDPDLIVNVNSPTGGMLFGTGICAWALQEKLKGRTIIAPRCGYGGWGINTTQGYPWISEDRVLQDPNLIPENALKTRPYFDMSAPAGPALYAPATGSAFASPAQSGNRMLAEMMPARTLAAGRLAVNKFGPRNFDMSALYRTKVSGAQNAPWPGEADGRWRHCDFRVMAYIYVYGLYDTFVETGELK